MKIAIDIDNTVFTNNSIIYKLLNNVQILGDKNDTTLEFSKVSPKPIPTKGLLKKIFPFDPLAESKYAKSHYKTKWNNSKPIRRGVE